MTQKRVSWSTVVGVLVVFVLLGTVARSVLAGSPTTPRARDIQHAARIVRPAVGSDERMELPAGDLVGGNGIVEPADRETRVAGQTPGRIRAIRVNEGDHVAQGEVLVEFENGPETAGLAAAQADLDVARTDLARMLHGSRIEDIEAAESESDAARERAQLSAAVLARNEALAPSGAVTADELDRARRQSQADRFVAAQFDARRRLVRAGSRHEDVASARAHVAAAVARRDQAQASLDRLTVRAPIAGEVLQVRFRSGEYYNPAGADALVVMGDTRTLRVRVDVDERDIARVTMGAPAFAVADAFRGERFVGHVVEVGRHMGRKNVRTDDPTERIDTKILEVVVQLDAPDRLVPGQRVMSYIGGPARP